MPHARLHTWCSLRSAARCCESLAASASQVRNFADQSCTRALCVESHQQHQSRRAKRPVLYRSRDAPECIAKAAAPTVARRAFSSSRLQQTNIPADADDAVIDSALLRLEGAAHGRQDRAAKHVDLPEGGQEHDIEGRTRQKDDSTQRQGQTNDTSESDVSNATLRSRRKARCERVAYHELDEFLWNDWEVVSPEDSIQRWRARTAYVKATARGRTARQKGIDPGTTNAAQRAESRPSDELLNYTPYALLKIRPTQYPEMSTPWQLEDQETARMTGMEQLNAEIDRFIHFMKPTSEERSDRRRVAAFSMTMIEKAIEQTGLRCKPTYVGSEQTGLATCFSDIDIDIVPKIKTERSRKEQSREILSVLYESFRSSIHYDRATFLSDISIPLVSAIHRKSMIEIQVVANIASARQHVAVKRYLSHYPHLESVFFLLRTILSSRGLLDAYHGGLSSYCVFMMIVAAFKHHGQIIAQLPTVAEQLLYVLDFYANFDAPFHGIDVATGQLYPMSVENRAETQRLVRRVIWKDREANQDRKEHETYFRQRQRAVRLPWMLSLHCPVFDNNDLGRSCYAFRHIQETFSFLHTKLTTGLREIDGLRSMTFVPSAWEHGPLLEPLVGEVHRLAAVPKASLAAFNEATRGGLKVHRLQLTSSTSQGAGTTQQEAGTTQVDAQDVAEHTTVGVNHA